MGEAAFSHSYIPVLTISLKVRRLNEEGFEAGVYGIAHGLYHVDRRHPSTFTSSTYRPHATGRGTMHANNARTLFAELGVRRLDPLADR